MASLGSDRDPGHLRLAGRLGVSLPQVSWVSTSPCQQAGKRKGRKGTALLTKETSRMLEPLVCLHAIGQTWVTWPHPAEMKSGKCSLYSKWAAPSETVGFIVMGGERDRSLCPAPRCEHTHLPQRPREGSGPSADTPFANP